MLGMLNTRICEIMEVYPTEYSVVELLSDYDCATARQSRCILKAVSVKTRRTIRK